MVLYNEREPRNNKSPRLGNTMGRFDKQWSAGAALLVLVLTGALMPRACLAQAQVIFPSRLSISTASLRLVPQAQWPVFKDNFDKDSLLKAAGRSLEYLRRIEAQGPSYHTIGGGIPTLRLIASVESFLQDVKKSKTGKELNARLLRDFDLYQSAGSDGRGRVLFTAYYLPTVSASLKRTSTFKYPLYRWPPDLVVCDLSRFDPKLKGRTIIGRLTTDHSLVPYYSRREINAGVLAGKKLEIAWLANAFDSLYLHIQGSGVLVLQDGRRLMALHAITNGLKYRSVGKVLLKAGDLKRSQISHAGLRRYFIKHPKQASWAIDQDPRYVFFKLSEDAEAYGGIYNSSTTVLTAGRSIAVDPNIFPMGGVAYYETMSPKLDRKGHFAGLAEVSRFALPQDTGGAIKGSGHVDLYFGSGSRNETAASHQWAYGKLYILLKK